MSRKLDKDEFLKKIYYDVDEGFSSARDLYEKANKVEAGFTLDYVFKWLTSQPNKQTRNYKNYNSYTTPFPKYEFQIDLMVMSSLLNDVGVDVKKQPKVGFFVSIFSVKSVI